MGRVVAVRATETLERIGNARGNEVQIAPSAADGSGSGFLSGELLLISLGSCVLGSVRKWLATTGAPRPDVNVTVQQLASETDEPGPILVKLSVVRPASPSIACELRSKALSGGVSRRLLRGSNLQVIFADEVAAGAIDDLQIYNGRDM